MSFVALSANPLTSHCTGTSPTMFGKQHRATSKAVSRNAYVLLRMYVIPDVVARHVLDEYEHPNALRG